MTTIKLKTDAAPPPKAYEFDLKLPAQFDVQPEHTVDLPLDHKALIYAYEWRRYTGPCGETEVKETGWRIVMVGNHANKHKRDLSDRTEIMYPYQVQDHLAAAVKALLVLEQYADKRKKEAFDEDDDDC